MEDLILKLKSEIINQLNLLDVTVEDIGDEEPLFDDKFALDSIDALDKSFDAMNDVLYPWSQQA